MPNVLQIGTKVSKENTHRKQCKGDKMDDRWLGPYTVNRYSGQGVNELKDKKKNTVLKTKVNIKRLKVYTCSSEQNDLHAMMNNEADAEVSEGIGDKGEGAC